MQAFNGVAADWSVTSDIIQHMLNTQHLRFHQRAVPITSWCNEMENWMAELQIATCFACLGMLLRPEVFLQKLFVLHAAKVEQDERV